MRRYIFHKLLWLMSLLFLASCQQEECSQTEGKASLQLTVKALENTLHTRGVEDLDDDGTVSEEEIIVDGRKMYRLAVFLLDGTRVVSSTVLEADDTRFGNDNTEATVSFENLDYSMTYKLYAVANYRNYGGLTGKLADVNGNNVASGLTVSASDDKLCSKGTPYPLTLVKDIDLSPGVNTISGELIRTYARIRINVRNQSATNDLYISNLSFPAKFTQNSVDVFNEGGTANAQPVVASADAITPFVANTMIPKIDDESNVSETTIFDSYLLESTGGEYKYMLGVKYEGGTNEVYTVSDTLITSHSYIEDGGLYVIYNTNAGRYLYDNGDNVGAGSSYLTNGELNHNYVWKFTRTSNRYYRYTIESMGGSGKFMQSSQVNSSEVPLITNAGNSDYFTASTNGSNIRFQATSNYYYSYYYLSVNESTVCGHYSNSNRTCRDFQLFKVTKEGGVSSVSKEATIPISIIDKNTGEASPLTAIKRNDFINILVNVTYNEKTGEVEFEVSDWEDVNGDVTFD